MLAIAITMLFTLTGLIASAVVADSLIKARAAYARLMLEGEVMRAGFAVQAAAMEMSLRPKTMAAPRRVTAQRRPAMRQPNLLACVAA